MYGPFLALVGWFAQWSLDTVGYLPAPIGWTLLITSVIGVIPLPQSGIWLIIPVAIVMLRLRKPASHELSGASSGVSASNVTPS